MEAKGAMLLRTSVSSSSYTSGRTAVRNRNMEQEELRRTLCSSVQEQRVSMFMFAGMSLFMECGCKATCRLKEWK